MEADKISVSIGNISLGQGLPVLLQSMCNVSTLDTKACVDQCIRIFEAGGGLSRISARNIAEARNLKNIREELTRRGYHQPISADVHFIPAIALEAAHWVEKVRINPGNFANGDIESPFLEFLEICRKNKTAIRIGVNHGSLSGRILEKYGDTPNGMVESAMEYLRICQRAAFGDVVVSLKSSNTRVMVYANRLIKTRMEEEKMHYPLHLGVTEAGEGEDGRIRSAVGIGTLLGEGQGETIRISLTEDPEFEIPVAKKLIEISAGHIAESDKNTPIEFNRRNSAKHGILGGGQTPVVIARVQEETYGGNDATDISEIQHSEPDFYFVPDRCLTGEMNRGKKYILNAEAWIQDEYPKDNFFPLFDLSGFLSFEKTSSILNFILIRPDEVSGSVEHLAARDIPFCLIFMHDSDPGSKRAFLQLVKDTRIQSPVLVQTAYQDHDTEIFQLRAASELAWYFIDGYADGIWLDNPFIKPDIPLSTAFKVLQASRSRMTQTEYIACPSCGRTLFNIQDTLAQIKKSTSHLKHLKIAVMGCIVNGPGEMADADYGYVGSGKGKVSLYRGKEIHQKNIMEKDAVKELVKLIKENGDWID
ncbi:(E)-4-hydroxy-3-methylbut-2-enyl-diphosphate synthase [Bacteroidota bacterium]